MRKKTKRNLIIGVSIGLAISAVVVATTLPFVIKSPSNDEKIEESFDSISLKSNAYTLGQFGMTNFSSEEIKSTINKQWIEENKDQIFSDLNDFDSSKLSNVLVNQVSNTEYSVLFNYGSKQMSFSILKVNQTQTVTSTGNTIIEIKDSNVNRNVQNKYYDSELINQYEQYGFKYPAWDFDYELNSDGNDWDQDIDPKTNMNTPSGVVNMSDLVYNERVDFNGQQVKYSDPNWIRSEISKSTLKKHRAADGMHEQKLSANQKAVDKFFSLPSNVTGPTALGLYAPAGEIVTLTFSDETYNKMVKNNINNFKIIINQNYWDNRPKENKGRISNRYPFVYTEFIINLSDLDSNHSYQFGTPFGGNITVSINSKLKSDSYNEIYKSYSNYVFNVKGAVEQLTYVHGITTQTDWNNQVQRVKKGELTAPEMSIDFNYGTLNLMYTGINEIAYVNINDIVYPKNAVSKWNDFLLLSEYFASRDVYNNVVKFNFKFNNDIWNAGSAYNVGLALACPLTWAKESFLTNSEWSIKNNWGNMHEINHSFEQNDAYFQAGSHGATNQVTMANFSLLSDSTRWRNIFNPTGENDSGGWSRFANMYSVIQYIKNQNYNANKKPGATQGDSEFEYQIYGLMLFMLGTYNYIDYARNDIATDNGLDANGNVAEGGFYEILELSDYFKLDFWPALQRYYPIWYDDGQHGELNKHPVYDDYHKWPKDYDSATLEQKAQIDRLNSEYKSFDFIGNIYACGSYLYDNNSGQYVYTNDTNTEYQIPAGKPYTFDFERGINWLENESDKYQFSWDQLVFEPTTKLGGKLELDSSNNKKLIYTPPANSLGEIDEFDIAIIPDANFKGRPSNYVDQYKWKIKVRQAANVWVNSMYRLPDGMSDMKGRLNYMRDESHVNASEINNLTVSGLLHQDISKFDAPEGIRLQGVFVAPEDGTYQIKIKENWNAAIYEGFEPTSEELYYNDYWYSRDWKTINKTYDLKKGDQIPLDIFVMNHASDGYPGGNKYKYTPQIGIKLIFNGQEGVYDINDYIYNPNAAKLVDDPTKIVTNSKYHYQSNRTIDYNKIQTSLFGISTSREANTIDISKYKFIPIAARDKQGAPIKVGTFNDLDKNKEYVINSRLRYDDDQYMEIWGPSNGEYLQLEFDVEFDSPTKIGSINFYHRTNNWTNGRPTKITIKDENDKILYDGKYGSQFNDRGQAQSLLTFDKTYEVSKLKFITTNDTIVNNSSKNSAIIFDAISFNNEIALKSNKTVSVLDPAIVTKGQWEYILNQTGINISDFNGTSIRSLKDGDTMSFNLYGVGFDLVGQVAPNNSIFEVWINDKLISTIDTTSKNRKDNSILFSYTSSDYQEHEMNVKIVNKSNKPLFINFIQTYGNTVYIGK